MPEPKKQSSPRKTGLRRSHIRLDLAKKVNSKSPVKAFQTKKQTPNLKVAVPKKAAASTTKAVKAAKASAKKAK